MKTGTNFDHLIRLAAEEEGIRLSSFSDDWAYLLEKDGKRRLIVSHCFPLNPASSAEVCRDKALCSEVLLEAGIPAVPHLFITNERYPAYFGAPSAKSQVLGLMETYPRIVLKDNYGSGGNSVYFADSEESAVEALDLLLPRSQALALSPYIPVKAEYRTVVLDGEVRLVFLKKRAEVVSDGKTPIGELIKESSLKTDRAAFGEVDPEAVLPEGERIALNWKHNLGQGARACIIEDPALIKNAGTLAKNAAEALNARFVSVDLVDDDSGLKVLEVNAGVMMEHFAGQGEEYFHIAKEIYQDALRLSFETPRS